MANTDCAKRAAAARQHAQDAGPDIELRKAYDAVASSYETLAKIDPTWPEAETKNPVPS